MFDFEVHKVRVCGVGKVVFDFFKTINSKECHFGRKACSSHLDVACSLAWTQLNRALLLRFDIAKDIHKFLLSHYMKVFRVIEGTLMRRYAFSSE